MEHDTNAGLQPASTARSTLYRKCLIREVTNRKGGFNWCVLTWTGKRVVAELADRAASRKPAAVPAKPAPAEPSPAEKELQYANAAQFFAALHPAAAEIVGGFQRNALDTLVEGEPRFSCGEVWRQIGAEPGQRLDWNADDNPEEWATSAGFNAAWAHLDRLAAAGKLRMDRWDTTVTEARDVLAAASDRRAPVVLDKRPARWQVLWHTVSPLTGEQWADLPVHSVVRTSQLLAGQEWPVVEQRLAARGLSRYGFPEAVSAGHALALARARWQSEGPHAAWFAFLDEDIALIDSVRAEFHLTPEQERDALTRLSAAFAAGKAPATTLTFTEAHAIASGQEPTNQG